MIISRDAVFFITDPPRGSAANTTMSPSQITSPRSMLEETAERIREWEIRNQVGVYLVAGVAEGCCVLRPS